MSSLVNKRGSLSETQKQRKITFAEAFVTVDALLIVDVSASMETRDVKGEGGVTDRWSEANRQLQRLQARFPGRLAVVAFSGGVEFCADGTLPQPQSSTDLLGALQFASPAAGCGIKFIVVSDGEPDAPDETLDYARILRTKIDAIHIGSSDSGRKFMSQLAACSGGASIDESVLELESVVVRLLNA